MHSYILALPVWVRKCVTLAKKSHPLLQSLIGFTGSWSSQEFSFAPNIFPTCPITGFFILSSFRSKCAKLPFIPISHIQSFLGATTISCFWAKIPYPLPFQPENYCRKKKKKKFLHIHEAALVSTRFLQCTNYKALSKNCKSLHFCRLRPP